MNIDLLGMEFKSTLSSVVNSVSIFSIASFFAIYYSKNKKLRNTALPFFLSFVPFFVSIGSMQKFIQFPWNIVLLIILFIESCQMFLGKKEFRIITLGIILFFCFYRMSEIRKTYSTDRDFPQLKKSFLEIADYIKSQEGNGRIYVNDLATFGENIEDWEKSNFGRKYLKYSHYFAVSHIFMNRATAGSFQTLFFPRAISQDIKGFPMPSEIYLDIPPVLFSLNREYEEFRLLLYLNDINAEYLLTPYELEANSLERVKVFRITDTEPFTLTLFRNMEFVDSYFIFDGEKLSEQTDLTQKYFRMRANLASEQSVFLKMNYFPGWKAKVDGKLSEVSLCSMQGFFPYACTKVPSGEHDVEFFYEGGSILDYLLVTCSLFGFLLIFFFEKFNF